jgi:hypothetical protein
MSPTAILYLIHNLSSFLQLTSSGNYKFHMYAHRHVKKIEIKFCAISTETKLQVRVQNLVSFVLSINNFKQ